MVIVQYMKYIKPLKSSPKYHGTRETLWESGRTIF
jgi:hypothetical protein